jgi:Concanavalin A-like lectin/glucanases superfamily
LNYIKIITILKQPHKNRMLKKSFLGFFLILVSLQFQAFSSHFRTGKIEWTVTPGTRTVNFTITHSWRHDDVDQIYMNFGDNSSSIGLNGNEILYVQNDYRVIETKISHTYASDGPFIVSFGSCCRISNLSNGADYDFLVSAKVCLANSNQGGPVVNAPTVIEMGSTGINSFQLNTTDPDGSPITYTTTPISGYSFVPTVGGNVASVSNSGLISWNTSGTSVGQLYLLKLKMSDGCAETEVELIIKIVSCTSGVSGTISGSNAILQGESTDLTITFSGIGPWTYKLSGTSTDVTTSVSPVTITVTPFTNTTYTLTSVSGGGGACGISNGSAIITVTCPILATITGTSSIFSGQTTDLTVTFSGIGPWTYRLSGTTTDITTSTSPVTIPVTPGISTTYSITSVSNNSGICGISSGSAIVTVNCPNVATISGTNSIISGQSTDLTLSFSGTGPWTYRLSGTNVDVTTNTSPVVISVTPIASTNYTITSVTHSGGFCGISTTNAFVTVNCPLVATVSGTTTIYKGQSTDINLAFTGTGPWTYRLSGTNTDVTTSTSPVVISVNPTVSTTYSITTVTHNNGFCAQSTGNAAITVICPVTATISGDNTINLGQSTNLQIDFTEAGPWSYKINGINTTFNTSSNPTIIPIAPTASTTYTLNSVSNSCGNGLVSGSANIVVNIPVLLKACYNFSGNANDGKGSNHGTVIGANLTTDRFGNTNSAYTFNGVNNFITIPANNIANPKYTYSAWVYTNNPIIPVQTILSVGNIGADQVLAIYNDAGNVNSQYWTIFSYIYNSSLPIPAVNVMSPTIANEWHHIVGTRTLNELKLYIDGVLVGTTPSTGVSPLYASPIQATIGARSRNDIQFFSGKIDDVKIYDGALNDEEVAYLYFEENGANTCSDFCSKFVYSTVSGNWNDPNTWSCKRIPTATDVVLIKQSHIIEVDNITGNAKNVIMNGNVNFSNGGTLQLNQ